MLRWIKAFHYENVKHWSNKGKCVLCSKRKTAYDGEIEDVKPDV